jgi:hypothetical protein
MSPGKAHRWPQGLLRSSLAAPIERPCRTRSEVRSSKPGRVTEKDASGRAQKPHTVSNYRFSTRPPVIRFFIDEEPSRNWDARLGRPGHHCSRAARRLLFNTVTGFFQVNGLIALTASLKSIVNSSNLADTLENGNNVSLVRNTESCRKQGDHPWHFRTASGYHSLRRSSRLRFCGNGPQGPAGFEPSPKQVWKMKAGKLCTTRCARKSSWGMD